MLFPINYTFQDSVHGSTQALDPVRTLPLCSISGELGSIKTDSVPGVCTPSSPRNMDMRNRPSFDPKARSPSVRAGRSPLRHIRDRWVGWLRDNACSLSCRLASTTRRKCICSSRLWHVLEDHGQLERGAREGLPRKQTVLSKYLPCAGNSCLSTPTCSISCRTSSASLQCTRALKGFGLHLGCACTLGSGDKAPCTLCPRTS